MQTASPEAPIFWLFCNHSPDRIIPTYSSIKASDTIIAVDAGIHKVVELGLIADILLGDLDSMQLSSNEAKPYCKSIERHPRAKNESDTELAIIRAIELGAKQICICNDMQGRFDHAFALVQHLAYYSRLVDKLCIYSTDQEIYLLAEKNVIDYPVDSLVSLFAITDTASFEKSTGLEYCLDGLSLQSHQTRGLSNFITTSPAFIHKKSGDVLAVITVFD